MISICETFNLYNNEVLEETKLQQVLAGILGLPFDIAVGALVGGGQQIQKARYEKLLSNLKNQPSEPVSTGGILGKMGLHTLLVGLPLIGTFFAVKNQQILDELKGDIGRILDRKDNKKLLNLYERRNSLDKKELKELAELENKLWKNMNDKDKKYLVDKYKRFAKEAKNLKTS